MKYFTQIIFSLAGLILIAGGIYLFAVGKLDTDGLGGISAAGLVAMIIGNLKNIFDSI